MMQCRPLHCNMFDWHIVDYLLPQKSPPPPLPSMTQTHLLVLHAHTFWLTTPLWICILYYHLVSTTAYKLIGSTGGQKSHNALVQRVAYFLNDLTIDRLLICWPFNPTCVSISSTRCFFEPIGSLLFNAFMAEMIITGLSKAFPYTCQRVDHLVQRVDNCIGYY